MATCRMVHGTLISSRSAPTFRPCAPTSCLARRCAPRLRDIMNLSQEHLSVSTTCAYCGVGCGVRATPRGDGGFDIAGDAAHPANFGRLCVKGSALGETIGLEGRLLHPMMRSA